MGDLFWHSLTVFSFIALFVMVSNGIDLQAVVQGVACGVLLANSVKRLSDSEKEDSEKEDS